MKRTLFAVLTVSAGILAAQNLIHDPDFDKGSQAECRFDAHSGTMKNKIVTEEDGNKCLRIEHAKQSVDPKTGKNRCLIALWFGKDDKGPGFKVEPNTVYEFEFQFKGNYVPKVEYSEWSGPEFWKNIKTRGTVQTVKPVVTDKWTTVKGSFTTTATAKTAALHLELYGSKVPVGAYFMIDKVKVEKKK